LRRGVGSGGGLSESRDSGEEKEAEEGLGDGLRDAHGR